eukprot:4250069-Amphidinium_carterae.2
MGFPLARCKGGGADGAAAGGVEVVVLADRRQPVVRFCAEEHQRGEQPCTEKLPTCVLFLVMHWTLTPSRESGSSGAGPFLHRHLLRCVLCQRPSASICGVICDELHIWFVSCHQQWGCLSAAPGMGAAGVLSVWVPLSRPLVWLFALRHSSLSVVRLRLLGAALPGSRCLHSVRVAAFGMLAMRASMDLAPWADSCRSLACCTGLLSSGVRLQLGAAAGVLRSHVAQEGYCLVEGAPRAQYCPASVMQLPVGCPLLQDIRLWWHGTLARPVRSAQPWHKLAAGVCDLTICIDLSAETLAVAVDGGGERVECHVLLESSGDLVKCDLVWRRGQGGCGVDVSGWLSEF